MGLLGNLLNFQQSHQDQAEKQRAEIYRSLMSWEAKLGGELFGPIPEGTRREFFCLDERTWVWHEEWSDSDGHHSLTTRYDVRPNVVLKSQGTSEYHALGPEESRNFYNAVILYGQKVLPQLEHWSSLDVAKPAN